MKELNLTCWEQGLHLLAREITLGIGEGQFYKEKLRKNVLLLIRFGISTKTAVYQCAGEYLCMVWHKGKV